MEIILRCCYCNLRNDLKAMIVVIVMYLWLNIVILDGLVFVVVIIDLKNLDNLSISVVTEVNNAPNVTIVVCKNG